MGSRLQELKKTSMGFVGRQRQGRQRGRGGEGGTTRVEWIGGDEERERHVWRVAVVYACVLGGGREQHVRRAYACVRVCVGGGHERRTYACVCVCEGGAARTAVGAGKEVAMQQVGWREVCVYVCEGDRLGQRADEGTYRQERT